MNETCPLFSGHTIFYILLFVAKN